MNSPFTGMHRLAALLQPCSTALDAGPRRLDAVRSGLARESAKASQLISSAMKYGFQGQGQPNGSRSSYGDTLGERRS